MFRAGPGDRHGNTWSRPGGPPVARLVPLRPHRPGPPAPILDGNGGVAVKRAALLSLGAGGHRLGSVFGLPGPPAPRWHRVAGTPAVKLVKFGAAGAGPSPSHALAGGSVVITSLQARDCNASGAHWRARAPIMVTVGRRWMGPRRRAPAALHCH